jgi:hypothetical protein
MYWPDFLILHPHPDRLPTRERVFFTFYEFIQMCIPHAQGISPETPAFDSHLLVWYCLEKKIKRPHSFQEMRSPFFSPKPFSHPVWVKEGYRRYKLLFQSKRLWRKGNMLSIGKFETKLVKNTQALNNFPVHSWIINHHRIYSDIFDTG